MHPCCGVLPAGVLPARKENMTAAQSSIEALRIAARAAEEKQGTNLFAVDASDAMGLIDGFLVVSAHNERLVNAVADEVEDALREQADLKPVRREGRSSGRWILLDFGDIVVHVQPSTLRVRLRKMLHASFPLRMRRRLLLDF